MSSPPAVSSPLPDNQPSSPLFYQGSSSQPGSDTYDANRAVSSPINFLSSQNRSSQYSDIRTDLNQEARAQRFSGSQSRRGDIGSDNTPRRLVDGSFPTSSSVPGLTSDTGSEPVRIIWGTNVSIQECADNFREFLMSFKMRYRKVYDGQESSVEPADDELYYVRQLQELIALGTSNLNLDTRNLLAFSATEKLYYQLLNYPQEIVSIMDQTIKDCVVTLAAESDLDKIETRVYKVRPYNITSRKGMRELNPGDIDRLVSVKGLVLRSTPIIPDMKVAFFKCNVCEHTVAVEIDRGVIQEPLRCPRVACSQTNSMVLIHNRSSFADKQVIKLQETPDLVPDGQTPHSVSLCVYDELVDSCRAGDRVEVTGIFRSIPIRANARQRALKALYKTYLDIVHVKKIDQKRLGVDTSTVSMEQEIMENQMSGIEEVRKITDDEVEQIQRVAARPDLYQLLARSIAPSIFELDDVKKGILLQLFGGTNKTFKKGGRYRGDINILLCGDPSTSKSQILQYVHKIAPRGVYTSGKGSSAVGLTAYITRDVDTKQLVLESGALVLSDGGVCCIDEFDKMSETTRSVLHEVMEQQTISIAKAGIITTLNARASILASANPIGSRYRPEIPVTENIDLPPPLLSRFDLVYLVLDKVDVETDRDLARHLTSLYLEDRPEHQNQFDVLPVEFLTLYINFAKQNYNPLLTSAAKDELVKSYVEMRKMGDDVRSDEKRITATTRQLESMIRLAEAHAKMRLSHSVELSDVKEAVRLMKAAIKEYATDPKTGKIDMNLVQTGKSVVQRQLQEDLSKSVMALMLENGADTMSYSELARRINEASQDRVDPVDISEVLKRLSQEDKLIITGEGARRSVRRTGR